MSQLLLKMKVISKTFPGVKALDGVEIEVMEGEIHALMGENGAGKSTFMKVLNGLLQPNTGEIFFSGQKVRIEGPQQALKLGISMIHQELNPVRDMTVAENIFLGREYTRGKSFFVDKKKCELEAKNLLINFGLNIEPSLLMKELSIAQTQMIEIMKAVSYGARLIIMDEPTSSLTDDEIRILFAKISDLKKKNVAVIYISHRIDEIFEIADKVTVLRDGKYIGTKTIEEIDKNQLIHMMVGRELNSVFPKTFAEIGKPVLQVKNLSGASFKDISFEVKSGEILGFYGLVGAGRSEVFKSIFGLDPHSKGVIMLEGKQLKIRKTSDAIKAGITMVTEDRKKYGLVLCRSIKENIALPNLNEFSKGPFLNHEKEKENCTGVAEKVSVKMSSLSQTTGNLSGGNQQKVVLCKWLIKKPKVLILDEPTRGIDVGAKAEIHSLMCEFAKKGMSIVMISSELPEVIGMSDRVIVMSEGRIKGEFLYGKYSQDQILKCALGEGRINYEN